GASVIAFLAGTLWLGGRLLRRRFQPSPPRHGLFLVGISGVVLLGLGLWPQPAALMGKVVRRILPNPMQEERRLGPNRGLTYWESGTDRRLYFAGGHRLIALDAGTGTPITEFGKNGMVDITKDLERSIEGQLFAATSPAVI